MPKYAAFFSYTRQAWTDLKGTPAQDLPKTFESAVTALGGSVDAFWLMQGAFDGLATLDLPDAASAAAVRVGLSATGSFETVEMEELIGVDALAGPLQNLPKDEIW